MHELFCTHLFDTWYPYIVSEVTDKIMANYKEYNIQAVTSLFHFIVVR